MAAAGLIALIGALAGDLAAVGLAYLGAACSVIFATGGVYRMRSTALLSQAAGAALGICVGALPPSSAVSLIVTASAAGVISGVVGGLGPAAPGFGIMLSIGVAFGQFGGSSLPWWQQVVFYLVGTVVVAAATLAPWLFRRGAPERDAAAHVLFAAADLCAAIGTDTARAARARLAAASAEARNAVRHPRVELVALAAAALYAEGQPVSDAVIDAIWDAAAQIQADAPVAVRLDVGDSSAGLTALTAALDPGLPQRPAASLRPHRSAVSLFRAVTSRTAGANGIRIGVCLGVATGIAVALHEPTHAFWLPLTVAVIVRPEYASVFVRMINRLGGTVIGAALAAAMLAAWPSGLPVAAAAAAAIGFAVLAAPKLYGLSVIGITASTLLSSSIGYADPVLPAVRLLDTAIGAVVAIVFGYLLWPGARRLPEAARLDAALAAAHVYLVETIKPPTQRVQWQTCRDDAYRLAHQARAASRAALLEPPPVSAFAARSLQAAIELEDVVDAITAAALVVDAGGGVDGLAQDIDERLKELDQVTALEIPSGDNTRRR